MCMYAKVALLQSSIDLQIDISQFIINIVQYRTLVQNGQ